MGNYDINVNLNFIDALSNTQALQASLEKLTSALGQFQSAVGNKATSSSSSTNIFTNYAKSATEAKIRIEKCNAELLLTKQAIRGLQDAKVDLNANEFKLVTTRAKELKQEIIALKGQLKDFGVTSKTANNDLANMFKSAFSLKSVFGSLVGILGMGGGVYALFQGLRDGIKVIQEFDLAQAKLRSVLGETAQGMEVVRNSAISLGTSSIFGAKAVTDLQIELAKLGFTKNDILNMQEAIQNLAIATQEDLTVTTEVVTNIIRAYQLSSKETQRVVDIMGKSFNDSALGLDNFREAIKYIAPVAHMANFSLEETVAVLEVMSNVGLKGSLAGTGFNNVMKAMLDPASKLAKRMGVTITGFEGFIAVLERAKKEGWDMSDIFGTITQRATNAFSTFMNSTDQIKVNLLKLKESAGTVAGMVNVQMDTIANQAKLVKSAWQGMWLAIDDGSKGLSRAIKNTLSGVALILKGFNSDTELYVNSVSSAFIKHINEANMLASLWQSYNETFIKLLSSNSANKKAINEELIATSTQLQSMLGKETVAFDEHTGIILSDTSAIEENIRVRKLLVTEDMGTLATKYVAKMREWKPMQDVLNQQLAEMAKYKKELTKFGFDIQWIYNSLKDQSEVKIMQFVNEWKKAQREAAKEVNKGVLTNEELQRYFPSQEKLNALGSMIAMYVDLRKKTEQNKVAVDALSESVTTLFLKGSTLYV